MKEYTKKIPLEVEEVREIIGGIENADYLYEEYVKTENFLTHNGRGGSKWNYINKTINETLPADKFQIEVMQRGIWEFLGIYDKVTGYLYTLMREKNLSNLRKNAESKLFHYINALSKLNEYLDGSYYTVNQQMSLLGDSLYNEEGEDELERILGLLIKKIDGKIKCYTLISFDISNGQVTSIKGIVPAIGMGYYKEEVWDQVLVSEYTLDGDIIESTVENNGILLQRKPKLQRKNKDNDKKKRN